MSVTHAGIHLQSPSPPAPKLPVRPFSELDAGLNTSAAWTEHLESSGSSSESGRHIAPCKLPRSARALYDFEGEENFRELTVHAGDDLVILMEELAEGWSLAEFREETGLIPRTYYTYTLEFTLLHNHISGEFLADRVEDCTIKPDITNTRAGVNSLIPQNTGEWFSTLPSLRHSTFRGKRLNRFSSFVTSGAEDWILKGFSTEGGTGHQRDASGDSITNESGVSSNNKSDMPLFGIADYHFIEAGPTWKSKIPGFTVTVHSPSKRTSSVTGAYTLYSVTSNFNNLSDESESYIIDQSSSSNVGQTRSITVYRRFSQFVFLHTALTRRLPGIALPPLPEKQYAGRFNDDFIEARRGDLQRYINKVVRHPIARYAEVTTFFLSCENDIEWKRQLPQHLRCESAGPAFYARVYHPAFNVDVEEAADTVERFENHTRVVDKGIQGLRDAFGKVRSARAEMSNAERLLSYSILSLITSTPLKGQPVTPSNEEESEHEDEEASSSKSKVAKGLTTNDGAWCWKEGCIDCLKLTKTAQRTCEILQGVADLYDDHARGRMLTSHEAMKDLSHPSTIYAPIFEMQKSTLSKYRELSSDNSMGEDVAMRCETVLNATMAEMTAYHSQKSEDFENVMKEHLDGEITFYEKVLRKLQAARELYESPYFELSGSSPRIPSIYERELSNPRLKIKPLPQPCAHVYDSGALKPISAAIQGSVGKLLESSVQGR